VDYGRRLALVVEREVEGLVEVAFVVQDAWQGKGLGTMV
jgi:hypothetical protein